MSSTALQTPSSTVPADSPPFDSGSSSSTSSILYSFLIVFLTLFAFAVVGAILWHHVSVRRMRRLSESEAPWDMVETKGRKTWKKPEFWHVWADEGSVRENNLSKWEDFLPLAVRKCPSNVPTPNKGQVEGYRASFRSVHHVPPPRLDSPPATTNNVEVAVLIAMPSPRLPVADGDAVEREDYLGACEIGTTYALYRDIATSS